MAATPLAIAFSPCPNDTFVFHALVSGLVPLPGRRALQIGSYRAGASPEDGRGWLRSGLVVAQLAVSLVRLAVERVVEMEEFWPFMARTRANLEPGSIELP